MSNFLYSLRLSRRSHASIHLDFLLSYKQEGKTLHVFFEGPEDESVYLGHLEAKKPKLYTIFRYRCANKDDVYRSYSRIDFKVNRKERVLFFVDKDLSNFLQEEYPSDTNIYVTEYYSIENELVTRQMVERIMREFLHVYDSTQIEIVCNEFETQHQVFIREMIFIMAWIIHAKSNGTRINLGSVKLGRMYSMNDQLQLSRLPGLKPSGVVKLLEEMTKTITPADCWRNILRIARMLKTTSHPKSFIRGKYELWFLITFIEKAASVIQCTRVPGSETASNIPNLDMAATVLGPRLAIPHKLEVFLYNNWNNLS